MAGSLRSASLRVRLKDEITSSLFKLGSAIDKVSKINFKQGETWKKLNKDLAANNQNLDELSMAYNRGEKDAKKYKRERGHELWQRKQNIDLVGKEVKAMVKGAWSMGTMRKAAEQAAKGAAKLAKAGGKAGVAGTFGIMSKAASLVGQKLLNIDEGFGRLAQGKGFTGFKQAMSDLVRGVLQKATQALSSFVRDGISEFARLDKAMRESAIFAGADSGSIASMDEWSSKLQHAAITASKTTVFSVDQIAEAMKEIASIGQFETPEQLSHLAVTAATLASATGSDVAAASETLAQQMNAFGSQFMDMGMTMEEASIPVANILARVANDSAMNMSQLGDALQYVSPAAVAAGISLQEVVSMTGALSNMGFKASRAGTALGQVFDAMADPSAEAAAAMAEIDFSAFDEQGNMMEMGELLMTLKDRMAQVSSEEDRMRLMAEIFGVRGGRAIMTLMNDTEQYSNLLVSLAEDSANGTNLIAAANEAMMNTVAGQFSRLNGIMAEYKLAVMDALEPLLVVAGEGSGLLEHFAEIMESDSFRAFFQVLATELGKLIIIFNTFAEAMGGGLLQIATVLVQVLQTVVSAVGFLFESIDGGASIFETIASLFTLVFSAVQPLIPIFFAIVSLIIEQMIPVVTVLAKVFFQLTPVIMMIGQLIVNMIELAVPFIIYLAASFMKLLPILMPLIEAVFRLVNVIAGAMIGVLQMVVGIIMRNIHVIKSLIDALVMIINVIVKLMPVIMLLVNIIIQIVVVAFEILAVVILVILEVFIAFEPLIYLIVDLLVMILMPALAGVVMIFDALFWVIDGVMMVVKAISGAISDFVGMILGGLSTLIEFIKDTTDALADSAEAGGFDGLARGLRSMSDSLGMANEGVTELQDRVDNFSMSPEMGEPVEVAWSEDDLDDQFEDYEPNVPMTAEADFENIEVTDGVVQLRASDDLQEKGDEVEEYFGAISNILALQEMSAGLLGRAAENMDSGTFDRTTEAVQDNSVSNSNNTVVEQMIIEYNNGDVQFDEDAGDLGDALGEIGEAIGSS